METVELSSNTPQIIKFSTPLKQTTVSSSVSKVRVIIRVRPFLPQEIVSANGDPRCCISVLQQDSDSYCEEVAVHLKDLDTSRKECYKLDGFFGQEDDNVSEIFDKEVNTLIPGLLCGFNATVFAYGATGSGKTYTMQGTEKLPGLIPLAMSTILSMTQSISSTIEVSYFEVYLEKCIDLLQVEPKEVKILDDKDGQMHLKGLSSVPVNSMSEFNEVFSRGILRRKTAHTGLNDVSSRSHGVLVISVSTPCGNVMMSGKLNLIDLAGNEDNRRTCNDGIRLQESSKINQSLFALSNVIYALNNNKPRIPYRESKLTRILQDSLGGTSRALMVACLNPREYQESLHTVSLASRSRHITNFVSSSQKLETPKVRVDMEAKLQAWLESKGKEKSSHRMTPFLGKTPISSIKKPDYRSSAKVKPHTNQCKFDGVERNTSTHFRNLFNQEDLCDSFSEDVHIAAQNHIKENMTTTNLVDLDEQTIFQSDEHVSSIKSIGSSPICEKKIATPRNALAPVNHNVNVQNSPSTDKHQVFSEPETPDKPFQQISTPLDNFSARSCSLKSSLVQEYINFLNTASKEELKEIKGIGLKMVEYIVELRETSPLKSLNDLQKMGLSSKQVNALFNKAARGIFDIPEQSQSHLVRCTMNQF